MTEENANIDIPEPYRLAIQKAFGGMPYGGSCDFRIVHTIEDVEHNLIKLQTRLISIADGIVRTESELATLRRDVEAVRRVFREDS